MTLALIPQPKRISLTAGTYKIPVSGTIGISGQAFFQVADQARNIFDNHKVSITFPQFPDSLIVRGGSGLKKGGYRIVISRNSVVIEAADETAAFYGLETLKQISLQSKPGTLPCLRIEDWPDFQERGVYYDVCRGRVPKLEELLRMVETLAEYKINHFQLYIEHTFAFRRHPDIGKDASPLSAEDILQLDRRCRELHIEMVPSLASFGHLATVLKHKRYHKLAEIVGGSCLAPANPDTYKFLDSLFAEFLPLFSSKRFNVCCDETWDLGKGRSKALCERKGNGVVYLGHIIKLNDLVHRYGKKMMFWGDIIRHYPELIKKIPRDVTVLDWAYSYNHKFETIQDFNKAGLPFFACPGTSSWVSLFPRLPEAMANIKGFAAAGKKAGARGLLNTDWGDGGHYNFMEYSWHGYIFGAEQGWNTESDANTFTERFARTFLNSDRKDLVNAIITLGDVTHTAVSGCYQSIWQHLFFAPASDQLFRKVTPVAAFVSRNGCISEKVIQLDAAMGRKALANLTKARRAFDQHRRGEDPHGVLPYWTFAVDTIAHAARKLTIIGPGGHDTAAGRKSLQKEMAALKKRFQELWFARNRRSEIDMTLSRYDAAIKTMHRKVASAAKNPVPAGTNPFITSWHISRVVPRKGSVAQAAAVSLGDKMKWQKHDSGETSAGSGFVNLHEFLGTKDGIVYLANKFRVEKDGKWRLLVGHDGGVKAFVDGKSVLSQSKRENPAQPDRSRADVTLMKGDHEVVLAFNLDQGLGWGIFFRFEAPKKDPTNGRKPAYPKLIELK